MKNLKETLNSIFRPSLSPEIRESIDRANVRNIFALSQVICLFEEVILFVFLLSTREFGSSELTSFYSVLYCIVVSLIFIFLARRFRKTDVYPHGTVAFLTVLYYVLMALWAIHVTCRHYIAQDDVFLTFYTVILCFVCFIGYRPITSIFLTLFTFGGLFVSLWTIDRAAHVDLYNYAVLMLVTGVCFVVRYYQQTRAAENHLELKKNYDQLHYISTHDALTGAYNRQSFSEDTASYLNVPVTVLMTDIDYFKQFNDNFGHTVGDEVLRETYPFLNTLFPDGKIYRYGGDEFLILLNGLHAEKAETICRDNPGFPKRVGTEIVPVRIGFGVASGTAKEVSELTKLIAEADQRLYEMKLETHKNDPELRVTRTVGSN